MNYEVTIYVNVSDDMTFFIYGLRPNDPIAEVGTWTLDDESPLLVASTMWAVGNKEEEGIGWTGTPYPRDVRSLSVGDLLKIVDDDGKQTFLAVESNGWRDIVEPTNRIVALNGTRATSRR